MRWLDRLEKIWRPLTIPNIAVYLIGGQFLIYAATLARMISKHQAVRVAGQENPYAGMIANLATMFTEIADTLKTPVNTIKSRLYYGLSALKKTFDQWHITEDMMRYEL